MTRTQRSVGSHRLDRKRTTVSELKLLQVAVFNVKSDEHRGEWILSFMLIITGKDVRHAVTWNFKDMT